MTVSQSNPRRASILILDDELEDCPEQPFEHPSNDDAQESPKILKPGRSFRALPDLPAIATLRERHQWVAWKYVPQPPPAEPKKVPINPASGNYAKANDPATWGSYGAAVHRVRRDGLAGVGYNLTADDGLCGIDLDDCRDPDTEELMPWAAEVVALAETYVEVSPSGCGLRLLALGKPARAIPSGPDGVEMYGVSRYLTVTGRHLPGTPTEIRHAPETLSRLQARVDVFRSKKTVTYVEPPREPSTGATVAETPESIAIARAMLTAIDRKLGRGPERDIKYGEWLRVVFAVFTTRWSCAIGLARDWSARGSKWDEAVFDKLVRSFDSGKPGGLSVGTLVHIAREHGYDGPTFASLSVAAVVAVWPEPKPFPSGLLPVEPFDPDMVPKAVAPWIMDVAERMQCPPDFVAIPVLVALGAVLGRRVAIRPQRHTDWFEVPNLWGCIVGRPGAMKSPAMSEALRPLDRLETEARRSNAEALSHHSQAVAEHKIKQDTAMKAARSKAKDGGDLSGLFDFNPPEELRLKRFKCNDTTYEALGVILANNPNGVLVFRDELVSLLKTLDREDNAAARGFYLTSWNGTSGYTFDRIMRGLTHIDAACLSLLGSTQPGKLAAYVGRALGGGEGDDGLMQRFSLLVWPDDDAPWREVDRFPDSAAKNAAFAAFARLDALTPADVGAEHDEFDALPYLRLDDAAADLFAGWRADLETRLRNGTMHPALVSHLSKYRKLVPTLALLNHLVDRGTGPVTGDAVRRALRFAGYLESHACRAYGSGRQAEVGAAKVLLTRIRRGDLAGEFSARDVLRHGWSNLSEKDQVAAGLDLLEDLGWVRSRRIDTGGRPKMIFSPNPRAASAPQAGAG